MMGTTDIAVVVMAAQLEVGFARAASRRTRARIVKTLVLGFSTLRPSHGLMECKPIVCPLSEWHWNEFPRSEGWLRARAPQQPRRAQGRSGLRWMAGAPKPIHCILFRPAPRRQGPGTPHGPLSTCSTQRRDSTLRPHYRADRSLCSPSVRLLQFGSFCKSK